MPHDLSKLTRDWVAKNVVLAEHCDIEYSDVEAALQALLQQVMTDKVFIIQHSIKDSDGSFRVLTREVFATRELARDFLKKKHDANNSEANQAAGYYAKYVNLGTDLSIEKDGLCVEFFKFCDETVKHSNGE